MKTASWFVLAAFAVCVRATIPAEDALLKTALDAKAGVVERTRAFADLRAVATERSLTALAPLLTDSAWSYLARSVVDVMPGAAADRALLAALESARDDTLRAGLVNSLGHRRTADAVPPIAKLAGASNQTLADAALNALGNIGNTGAADALIAYEPPAALKTAWADAALRAAETLQAGQRGKSLALYQAVKAKGPSLQAAAAWMGIARLSAEPAAVVVLALQSDDESSRVAALAVLRSGEFGTQLTTAAGNVLASLPVEVQVRVLSVLYDRGDRTAAAIARRALTASDSGVSAAAAKLLSVFGEPADAPALVRMMVGADEPAPSARLALARIAGADTTARLLEAFRKGGATRVAALEVLVSRGYRALLTELLQPELYADESFRALAANAILTLGTDADLERVLELHRKLPAAQRGPLETALRRIAAKDPSPDAAATIVFAAAEKLPLADRGPLYVTLAAIGGDVALTSLSGMLKSGSVEQRKAALRALGNWRDARPAAALLAVARDDADAGVRALAVRSATSLFTKSAFGENNAPAPKQIPAAIDGLRKTWAAAEQPAEKNAIVASLRTLKDPKAIAAAEELERQMQGGK